MSNFITLHKYIEMLQGLEREHGGDIPVIEYIDDYDGAGLFYTEASIPELVEDDWFLGADAEVEHNAWHAVEEKAAAKSAGKIDFKKAVQIA